MYKEVHADIKAELEQKYKAELEQKYKAELEQHKAELEQKYNPKPKPTAAPKWEPNPKRRRFQPE